MLAFGEPLPTISNVSPKLGPTGGATNVTLTGASFTGATGVKFGSTAATSFTVVSNTVIEAVAPAGTGTVDITITSPSGTSPIGPVDRYTYQQPPTVTKLSVKAGPAPGGTSVTITGTEFTGASDVKFGETSATKFTVNSATSITATSPAGSAGSVDVRVRTAGGLSAISMQDRFLYTPTVEALAPSTGPAAGGTSVTVTGSGFALGSAGTTFRFGATRAKSVTCTTSTSCTMIAPAGAVGTVDVVATVNKAKSPINPGDHFTYS
jgi:hypothetical protein